jgi:hypothetical protein
MGATARFMNAPARRRRAKNETGTAFQKFFQMILLHPKAYPYR